MSGPLLTQIFLILCRERVAGLIVLLLQTYHIRLASTLLSTNFDLLKVRVSGHTLVLSEIVKFGDSLLLSLVEFIVELACVDWIARPVNMHYVRYQLILIWLSS